MAYRFAALCLFSRRSGVLKVCTVFVKRAYSTIPRGFCVISTAQQLKVGRRTNRVRFCFRHPGSLFLTQKRHRTSGNRSLSCLAGHLGNKSRVYSRNNQTKKRNFPPPGKKSIFQAFTTEKRICCVLICNPMGFLFYWLLSPLFRLTSLVLERSV